MQWNGLCIAELLNVQLIVYLTVNLFGCSLFINAVNDSKSIVPNNGIIIINNELENSVE